MLSSDTPQYVTASLSSLSHAPKWLNTKDTYHFAFALPVYG